MNTVFEYRGVSNLVYAKVLTDDATSGYTTGAVKPLSPVAEIGRTTETSSEAHYYDNQPMIVINTVGADELTLTVAVLDLETYAEITGQTFDPSTGSLIEGERTSDYYAIGYKTKGTDGKERYVWRYKGQFGIPDETSSTETDGVDTNNMELTWTGVNTASKFDATGKTAKSMITDERYGYVDLSTFFSQVTTPDNISQSVKTANVTFTPAGSAVGGSTPIATFSTSASVTLSCATSGASIYYTIDGTEPTSTAGTLYSGAITVSADTNVRARAYKAGNAPSDISEVIYIKQS